MLDCIARQAQLVSRKVRPAQVEAGRFSIEGAMADQDEPGG